MSLSISPSLRYATNVDRMRRLNAKHVNKFIERKNNASGHRRDRTQFAVGKSIDQFGASYGSTFNELHPNWMKHGMRNIFIIWRLRALDEFWWFDEREALKATNSYELFISCDSLTRRHIIIRPDWTYI